MNMHVATTAATRPVSAAAKNPKLDAASKLANIASPAAIQRKTAIPRRAFLLRPAEQASPVPRSPTMASNNAAHSSVTR
jgi:hypothetical protein